MLHYLPRYETLSRLSDASLFLIGDRLKRFTAAVGPLRWPLNACRLAIDLADLGILPMTVVQTTRLKTADGHTVYDAATNSYLMVLKMPPEKWWTFSAGRRFNFTAAHELGHICLGHLKIPDWNKPDSWIERENAEADEFASRLLMPRPLVLNARFGSRAEMAEAFLVSGQALFHRLNNLRRLDRLAPDAPVCPRCGNRKASPLASFCRVCGAFLGKRIPERAARLMPLLPPEACPYCGIEKRPSTDGECEYCGLPRNNHCLAEYNRHRHPNPPDALFCETCGAETSLACWRREAANGTKRKKFGTPY